jgi:hypothetical protein
MTVVPSAEVAKRCTARGERPRWAIRKHSKNPFVAPTRGIVLRISFYPAAAVLRAIGRQSHFVCGMLDGFQGRLRRDKITIRMPIPTNEPPNTAIIRLMRWRGA